LVSKSCAKSFEVPKIDIVNSLGSRSPAFGSLTSFTALTITLTESNLEDTKYEYQNRLQDLEERLSTRLSAKEFVATINGIGYAKLDAQWASSPTDHLMRYTLQDIAALDYLRLNNSEHTQSSWQLLECPGVRNMIRSPCLEVT
jgi:hypothetical protein